MPIGVLSSTGCDGASNLHSQRARLVGCDVTNEARCFFFVRGHLVRENSDDAALFVEAHRQSSNLVLVRSQDNRAFGLLSGNREEIGDDARTFKLGEYLLERDTKRLELLFFHPEESGIGLSANNQPEPALTRLAYRFGLDSHNIVKLTALQWHPLLP